MNQDLADWMRAHSERTQNWLADWLDNIDAAGNLLEAVKYSLMAGGKRLRPALVYATAALGDKSVEEVLPLGAAVECIHTYSLAHDDLPAMDDDDLRRGKPACHIAFGEATAILVGDGLQTLAFEILTTAKELRLDADARLKIIQIMAKASGLNGMVAGQALDMATETPPTDLSTLERLHDLKTGALLSAAVEIGAVAAGLPAAEHASLVRYGQTLGRAFQVTDDCLDVTQSSQTLGKPQHSDASSGKHTFVTLLGIEGATAYAQKLSDTAIEALSSFGEAADKLRALADFTVNRRS